MKNLFEVFSTFFKIGLFTFGGGYAMLPIIEADVVDKKHWMEKDEFVDMLAIVQSVPGAIAINTSVYVGYKRAGFVGALAAILGTVLPSFAIILLVAMVFTDIQDNPTVEKVFKGMRPAVVALIAAPLIRMGKAAGITWKTLWIPIAAALVVWIAGVSPVYVIIGAIVLGISWNLIKEKKERKP